MTGCNSGGAKASPSMLDLRVIILVIATLDCSATRHCQEELPLAFEATFKRVDDILWKEAGCTTELDYTEQTSWMLFLKYLDDLEQEKAQQ